MFFLDNMFRATRALSHMLKTGFSTQHNIIISYKSNKYFSCQDGYRTLTTRQVVVFDLYSTQTNFIIKCTNRLGYTRIIKDRVQVQITPFNSSRVTRNAVDGRVPLTGPIFRPSNLSNVREETPPNMHYIDTIYKVTIGYMLATYGLVDKRQRRLLKFRRVVGNGFEQKVHAIRQFQIYVFRTAQRVRGIQFRVDGKEEEEIRFSIFYFR